MPFKEKNLLKFYESANDTTYCFFFFCTLFAISFHIDHLYFSVDSLTRFFRDGKSFHCTVLNIMKYSVMWNIQQYLTNVEKSKKKPAF